MQLHPIDEQEPPKELVCRKRKAAQEKGQEHYPKSGRRRRRRLRSRDLDVLRVLGEVPLLRQLQEVRALELGAVPRSDGGGDSLLGGVGRGGDGGGGSAFLSHGCERNAVA